MDTETTSHPTSTEESDILKKLSKYYREVLKYVSSSASRVLQNVATGQKYGLVADMKLLVPDPESLKRTTIKIHKPKKSINVEKFEEEESLEISVEIDEQVDPEEPEITDEEIAWSAVNKIWRTQENNPYERETLIGEFLVKTVANKKNLLAPLLISQVEITYDPITSTFNITRLLTKPDLNRSLIATLLPDDSLGPVRSQVNEIFLEAEEVDTGLIKRIIELISNHVTSLKDINIIEETLSLNEISEIEDSSFVASSFVLINTPKTGSFVLDDLDALAEAGTDISGTPIEDLLTVNFNEQSGGEGEESSNLKQEVYYFPLKSNTQQQRICDEVMSKKLTVVWGPPGTGKSETISNLVCHLVANGKSVLVTSQQQKALEVVRDKLKKNVSLSAPKHPNLNIPLELALIKGEKESAVAEDIRSKIQALGVYTLGAGSYWEINSKLEELRKSLKENREKSLLLMKRFSELKISEKQKYTSKKDSPLRLQDLREFSLISINEHLNSEDQNKNAHFIKHYAELLCYMGNSKTKYFDLYGSDIATLNKNLTKINNFLEVLDSFKDKINRCSDKESTLAQELIKIGDLKAVIVLTSQLVELWEDLRFLSNEIVLQKKNFKKQLQYMSEIKDSSYGALEKVLKKVKVLEKDVQNLDLPEGIEIDNLNINELEQCLEILKNTKVRIWTNMLDKSAKEALEKSAQALNISTFDWRSKDLICTQLQKIVNLRKARQLVEKIEEEINLLELDLSTENLSIDKITQFALELEGFLRTGRLLKKVKLDSSNNTILDVISKYIDLSSIENTVDLIKSYQIQAELYNEVEFVSKDKKITLESLDTDDLKKLFSISVEAKKYIQTLIDFLEVDDELKGIPVSKENICKLIEENGFQLPKIFEKSELIVEQYRLARLYGSSLDQETTETVARILKTLSGEKKQLIFNYILYTRLLILHEASRSKIANSNLVKLKTLLGRRKKTLNFLRQKNAVDFAQVLHYFPCWIASIDDVARYFPLEKGLFDYVIVDEASQCSQTSIPHLFYRSKNAVIVGDEKQLPNANLRFLQKGIMDSLQKKYGIDTHEKALFFDCKENSLLDFSKAATPQQTLIEHFRCDPTIIYWSNEHVYNRMMKIMTPIWENRFNPPMEVRYIANGAEDVEAKVNPVEAQAVIEEVKSLVNDSTNEGLTIGVISPFRPQADLISELIYQEISPELIAKFGIQSRTVDGFQGDERDIILYSMRFSSNGKPGSITAIESGVNEEGFKRMNVAFTRARRKAIIFTSQKPSQFPGKHIKSFMEHASTIQKTYSDPFQPKEDKFDSQFEENVCGLLRGRGVNVITQFECAGYRIDQVLFDKDGRTLALELDGDFKFDDDGELPPEYYMRQATIERVTEWDVYRVTASIFYLDPEKAIDEVIDFLKTQPTRVERKLNQTNIETSEVATGLTQETNNTTEDNETQQILGIVESQEIDKPKLEKKGNKEQKSLLQKQQVLFSEGINGNSLDKNFWFALSHWGKITGNISSFQNRFCYSLGIFISKNHRLTEKQESYGKKIVESALEKGFVFEKR